MGDADPPIPVLLLAGRLEARARSAYTLRLAQGLPGEGFAPAVACVDAARLPADARGGAAVAEYPNLDRPVWGRVVRAGLLYDLRHADDPPALVHAQGPEAARTAAYLAKRLGVPAVVTFHAPPTGRGRLVPLPGARRHWSWPS